MQPIEAIFLLTNNINIIKINTSFSDKHKNKTVNNDGLQRKKKRERINKESVTN